MESAKNYSLTNLSADELLEINDALDQSVIIAITDEKGIIKAVNDRFCKISKYDADELIGQDHRILNSGYHPKPFFKKLWETIRSGKTWTGDICNKAKDGSIYWVKTTIVPFLNEAGQPYKFISIRSDITAKKKIKQMIHLAHHDELTGLPNRRALDLDIDKLIPASGEQATNPFAVILFDINRFKNINDSLGYNAGDMVLQTIAKRLKTLESKTSSFYRLSSDKFVCIYTNPNMLDKHIDALLEQFNIPFRAEQVEFYLNISIGVSLYPDHALRHEDLIKYADIAMQQIKKVNSHNYMLYQPQTLFPFKQDLLLEAKLQYAVRNQTFELHYQPKIDIRTGQISGMEALIRWYDEELGHVRPDFFIPIAEECGLIADIGDWVTKTAGEQVKKWNEQFGLNLKVAVNISPKHLARYDFIDNLLSIIESNNLDTSMLEIEITELSMLDQTPALIEKIKKIKAMGIAISIDDFGMGYSSLSYLKEFPIDALKIDRYFIKNLSDEKEAEAMVSAIISLAHALNLNVVAEGVENEIELNILKKHHCEYVQGFLFSKPLNVKDFEHKLVVGL